MLANIMPTEKSGQLYWFCPVMPAYAGQLYWFCPVMPALCHFFKTKTAISKTNKLLTQDLKKTFPFRKIRPVPSHATIMPSHASIAQKKTLHITGFLVKFCFIQN